VSIVVRFVVAALLTVGLLRAVAWWRGTRIPLADALIVGILCAGLAALPAGIVLATIIMALLLTRASGVDVWPEAALMVVGSEVVWIMVYLFF
jgi:hypothetical protein